jgi:hypothetical protein
LSTKAIEHATDRCTAKTHSSGYTERCKQRPIKGATVCKSHGGVLPQVKRAAAVRLATTSAQRMALKRFKDRNGIASTQDAITELERLASEATVFKDVCREAVEELLEAGQGFGYEAKAGEQIRAAVVVYERALDRCNTILANCVKLNIAERRQKLNEAEAAILAMAIKNILSRLELSPQQRVIAGSVVPEELRAISAAVSQ